MNMKDLIFCCVIIFTLSFFLDKCLDTSKTMEKCFIKQDRYTNKYFVFGDLPYHPTYIIAETKTFDEALNITTKLNCK